ncbi:MAG: Spy/CpxP family protein refolding chaperone [Deltaproteobacteria bacterium]|nr:Spy/CpxP family protein refolding chaperone [Deltaproteobacteria bacterium]
MKKMSIAAAVLLMVGVTTLAMAGPKRAFFDGKGHMNQAVIAALELTSEQTEKIQTLHESAKKEIIPVKAQLATKRAEMKLLWTQTSLDADKIKATQKEIQTLRTQIRDTQTDMRIAFRNLLTPEQTSKLLASGFGRDGRGKKGRGYGKGKGGGYGKGSGCGNWGPQCGGCPRNTQ